MATASKFWDTLLRNFLYNAGNCDKTRKEEIQFINTIVQSLQAFACTHAGVCFCCFDVFLCMLNIHTAAQFKILQHNIETICIVNDREITKNQLDSQKSSVKYSEACYNKFKSCVRRHQDLIKYVEDLESVFTFLVLAQLLVSSVMLCVAGFQVAQVK